MEAISFSLCIMAIIELVEGALEMLSATNFVSQVSIKERE